MTEDVTHLHIHSEYSVLDGAAKLDKLVSEVQNLGQTAVALTDHGNMFGAFDFYHKATAAGIKPILGMEAYVAPESRHHKKPVYWGTPEQKREDVSSRGAYTHLTLLARNAQGLRNLYKLHSLSFTEGFYYHGRIDHEILAAHSAGLIVTTGCAGSETSTRIRLGQFDEARKAVGRLQDIIEPGSLFVEVMNHEIDFEPELNAGLARLSGEFNLPMVLTNDSHYVTPDDVPVHDALCWLQSGGSFKFSGSGYHIKSRAEMIEASPFGLEPVNNTLLVAEMVKSYADVFTKRDLMPKAIDGKNLRDLTTHALYEFKRDQSPDYYERLMYELEVIEGMGYADYFLVLSDIISWAKSQGIYVGPARGSAAGSLVAYLLGITTVDPIEWGLLFERFLNPARISVPDIDVDVEDDRRDELFEYAVQKYGFDRVAHCITLGTIGSKAALKDANRVLGGTFSEGTRLTNMVPEPVFGRQAPLSECKKIRVENPEVYDLATGLEGLIRNTGKHAAGVVISPVDLDTVIPVKLDKDATMLDTGFPQKQLEELGLTKFDLLGLKNLSIIKDVLEMIDEDTA